jgi:hypothetical protein
LIFLVDPHKEGLVLVVEDTSSLRPVSLKESRLEVLVVTLEEEVIFGKLLLLSISKFAERVVLTLEVTSELGEGSNDLGLNLESLLLGDLRAEGVLSEVTANSDTGGVDHFVLIVRESGAVQLSVIHVRNVLISLAVAVIFINNFIEERSEGIVRVVRTSVHTDT